MRRNQWMRMAIAGCACAVVACEAHTASRDVDAARPVLKATADDEYAFITAVSEGKAFLASESGRPAILQSYLLDALDRRFDIRLVQDRPEWKRPTASRVAVVFKRIVDDTVSTPSLQGLDPIDQMVASAMYCRESALDAPYVDLVNREVMAGGYGLTHAALAVLLTEQNRCSISRVLHARVDREVDSGLREMAASENVKADLRYEACAVAVMTRRVASPSVEWMRRVVTEQNTNGGWSPESGASSSDHATVVAMWCLLERLRPVPGSTFLKNGSGVQ